MMVLVLCIAIALAAAMAGAFAFVVVILCAATLGVLVSRRSARAFFIGCSVFGWTCMFVAFGAGRHICNSLPTVRPIIRVYEAVTGPTPTTFKSPEDASRRVLQVVQGVNNAITVGHSLISLAVALVGGALTWLVVVGWNCRAKCDDTGSRLAEGA